MKATRIISSLLILAGSISSGTANAHSLPSTGIVKALPGNGFQHMNAHRLQNSAVITWVLDDPNVSAYRIERSWEPNNMQPLQVIPGESGRVSFKDDGAFPGYNYYRVTAIMNDGSEIKSDVISVRIVRNH